MKESYLVSDFRKTVAQRFGAQAGSLNAAFDARLQALLKENAGESKEKQRHLRRQILPGMADAPVSCRRAARPGALPSGSRHLWAVDADSLRPCGGLCRTKAANRHGRLAH